MCRFSAAQNAGEIKKKKKMRDIPVNIYEQVEGHLTISFHPYPRSKQVVHKSLKNKYFLELVEIVSYYPRKNKDSSAKSVEMCLAIMQIKK